MKKLDKINIFRIISLTIFMVFIHVLLLVTSIMSVIGLNSKEVTAQESHALSLRGAPKYDKNFRHFDYVSSSAKKGGEIKLASLGAYDNFNTLSIEGNSAPGLSLIYDTLTTQSKDEPFTHYANLAQTMNYAKDKLSITFKLNPNARWHDGVKITSSDVVFSFEAALDKEKGLPSIKYYLADIKEVKAIDDETVTFYFKKLSPELHLILGDSIPILPKHFYKDKDIYGVSFEKPLGSGAYKISLAEKSKLVYERVADYWGENLPVNKYRNNFDKITYEVFQDRTIIRETVKAGKLDLFVENVAKEWATGYDIDVIKSGQMIKRAFETQTPSGMQAFIYNLDLETFKDPILREALAYAFDFEWLNKSIFYSAYTRIESFYGPKEMSSYDLPDADELELLKPIEKDVPKRIFSEVYKAPKTEGTQASFRKNLLIAKEMLGKGGYVLKGGKLISPQTKKPVSFVITIYDSSFERIVLPFIQNLKRLGVDASIKKVDVTKYIKLVGSFEYDMIIGSWGQSFSPGNEQYSFFGSDAGQQKNTRNYSRIKEPTIDYVIDKIVKAESLRELNTAIRVLDRLLLFNFIVIPHWTINLQRVIYNSKFSIPKVNTLYGQSFDTWWID